MSTTTVAKSPELELEEAIRSQYWALKRAVGDVVKQAIELGEFLNQKKAKFDHGDWLKWLETKCGVPPRTAQRCQQLAKPENKAKLAAVMEKLDKPEALSLNKAVALIGNGASSRSTQGPLDYNGYQSKLIDKLKGMKLDSAEVAVAQTKKKLSDTIAEMKRVTEAQT